jgi:hypothetical protein
MVDYADYQTVIKLQGKAQEPETDNREHVRESHNFLDKRDGQWEPNVIEMMRNLPRYTLDKCNPVVDAIAGEIQQADFDIRVRPAGGEATKETAILYDGLIRNIENISKSNNIYNAAATEMVASGFACWEVVQDWTDSDSFDQDLLIRPINNAEDRVWFDPNAEMQDMSDAEYVFFMTQMSMDAYKEQFPDGSGLGLDQSRFSDVYSYKKESVTIGRFIYKKKVSKTIVLFSDGSTRELNDDLEKVLDELADQGIIETDRRERDTFEVWSRQYDGGGWLHEAEKTAFKELPVIPVYANFKIREGKIIYRGAVDKLIDPQRIYNYLRTREILDIILSPRPKYWMTETQVGSHAGTLSTLNTNTDPVQFYRNDPVVPGPPQQQGGAIVNPGMVNAAQSTNNDLTEASGLFGLNRGDLQDGNLSGVAIQSIQNKGDTSTIKYFKAMEVAICQTARVLVGAIPTVYDSNRQVRILSEDGSFSMKSINQRVYDRQSQTWVTVNDLRVGKYDVTCDVGPAFKNRQQESVKTLQELSGVIPGLAEITADIQLNNIASPGVDMAAERVREQLVLSGVVPESQLTDDEKQRIQQAQLAAQTQPQEPTAEQKIADAEIARVQAETADVQSRALLRQEELRIKAQKNDEDSLLKLQKQADDKSLNEIKIIMQQQQQSIQNQQAAISAFRDGQNMMVDQLKQFADTLKSFKDATGADAIISPTVAAAYQETADLALDQTEVIESNQ